MESQDLPPRHFLVTNLLEDSVDKISLEGVGCWLCTNKRRSFICQWCLRKGDFFSHSEKKEASPSRPTDKANLNVGCHGLRLHDVADQRLLRYIDRKMHMIKLEAGKIDVLSLIESKVEILHKKLKLAELVDSKKQQVLELEKRLSVDDAAFRQGVEEVNSCRQCSLLHAKRIKKLQSINESTIRGLQEYRNRIIRKKQDTARLVEEQKKLVNELSEGLLQIFPLSEVEIQPSYHEDLSPVSAALVEASTTSYVGGRWVDSSGSSSQLRKMVQIVESRIPLSISGSVFQVLETEVLVASLCSSLDPNEVTNFILPGLAYSAQMTNLLAQFLSLRLPKKVSYRSFLAEDRPAKLKSSFCRLVFNLLHIAYQLRVPAEELEAPYNPVKLLSVVLEHRRLPLRDLNDGCYLGNADLLSFTVDDETDEDENEEEEGIAINDWESVTAALPSTAPPTSPGNIHVAASFVTSAAAGVASLWRGFAGKY